MSLRLFLYFCHSYSQTLFHNMYTLLTSRNFVIKLKKKKEEEEKERLKEEQTFVITVFFFPRMFAILAIKSPQTCTISSIFVLLYSITTMHILGP